MTPRRNPSPGCFAATFSRPFDNWGERGIGSQKR